MNEIPSQTAKTAVKVFLDEQFNKKTEKEQKQLAKAESGGEHIKVAELKKKIADARNKYELDNWMDKAANWMAKQIGFGTHISKGIHPSSKGDNINFATETILPAGVVGHQSIIEHKLDASGNAAALPLFSFFDFVVDEQNNIKVKDLILNNDKNLELSLSTNEALSKQYFSKFRELLLGGKSEPSSSKYNKQVLWATNDFEYICIIPLYPSSFAYNLYSKINQLKYSDDIVEARKNRFNDTAEKQSYPTISDIATTIIGGSNPQGVSQLMSKQGGRNYLLPSMPPVINRSYAFKPSKFADSIFAKGLAYQCRQPIQQFANVIEGKKNTVDIREARKLAIDEILHTLFAIAKDLQTNQPAGWSKDYQLNYQQKLWLDPYRADLDGETDFAHDRQESEWHTAIIQQFATWLNTLIKAKFPDIKHDIGDSEHIEWEREIEDMMKQYERAGKGVFL